MLFYIVLLILILVISSKQTLNFIQMNKQNKNKPSSIKEIEIFNSNNQELFTTNTSKGNMKFFNKEISDKNKIYILMLKKIYNVCNSLKIPVFLSSGTLLGYYREGQFIAYDYDIDMGMFVKDFNMKLIPELKKQGFIHYRTFTSNGKLTELSFYYKNNLIGKKAKVDFFIHYPDEIIPNKIYWMSKNVRTKEDIKYRISDFDIKPAILLNQKVLVPSNTDKYLNEHYGEDWNIPKPPHWLTKNGKGYSYSSSPKSIVK